MKQLRTYLIAGLLAWIPIGVTILLVSFVVGMMDKTLALLPEHLKPENLLGFPIPGLGVLLTILILILTGALGTNFIGRAFMVGWESLLNRIPIVRSIYSGAKNFAELVFSDSSQSFKKVLLVEYPRKGIYSLAFQTSSQLGEVQGRTGEEVICCFVPTTPNPTSGFIIIAPKDEVTELDMEVDEALKMIISLGVVVPRWKKDATGTLPFKELPARSPRDKKK
ncbi:MAG TPA: DUF502 domain-containing protein [Woeseiaceae bacterium]|nr:DUF502 domain-containing protein [Woeseiaceae bacterium]